MLNRNTNISFVILFLLCAFLWPSNIHPVLASPVNAFQKCDVFVAMNSGTILWWRPNSCGIPSSMTFQGLIVAPTHGLISDMAFNNPSCALGPGHPCLYATLFDLNTIVVFDNTGLFLGNCGFVDRNPSTIVIDSRSTPGLIYVGLFGGFKQIQRFSLGCTVGPGCCSSPAFDGSIGVSFMDLGADLCTMLYTDGPFFSPGPFHVKSFDVCSKTQKADFASLPNVPEDLRILPDGSVLLADTSYDVHLNKGGAILNTCDSNSAGAGTLFSLSVLPSGKEFVSGAYSNNELDYVTAAHCDAGNPTPDFSFNAVDSTGCSAQCLFGGLNAVIVFGEERVSAANPPTLSVSTFFTDSDLNPLALDSSGNPLVDVTLTRGRVASTNPGEIQVWVNITDTSEPSLQSLKLNETLPVDWAVDPPWAPAVGAIHVYFANTTSLSTNPDMTQRSTVTVSTGNPEVIHLEISNFTATPIGHSLLEGQSILASVKLTYGLIKTTQSTASYPRNYADTAGAAAWSQPSYAGSEAIGTASSFFIAHAKVLGDVNGDFRVDILDAALLAYSYGGTPSQSNWNPNADFNNDGVVDIQDAATLAYYYGTSA